MKRRSFKTILREAWDDLAGTVRNADLVFLLGQQDLVLRYRRSVLGPFWITISMGIMIGALGVVFGQIFSTAIGEFLPFLAVGMILWNLLSSAIIEGCNAFTSNQGMITQLALPMGLYIFRGIWREFLFFLHNIIILPLVFLVMGKGITWVALAGIPGLCLFMLNVSWMVILASIICTRYRDLPQLVNSILQVTFYITPVMWMPQLLPKRAGLFLLDLNPAFHLLEIVRAPLLGQFPTLLNWEVSLSLAVLGWSVALYFLGRYRGRVAYWL